MTKKQINEKYGIEPIMKEMWVWDVDREKAFFTLVIHRRNQVNYPYKVVDGTIFRNASETNPNEPKKPKVGDIGYFWDDEESYLCSVLKNIVNDGRPAYYCSLGLWFSNFSKEKQPWMK
jgi:hypothetical protein